MTSPPSLAADPLGVLSAGRYLFAVRIPVEYPPPVALVNVKLEALTQLSGRGAAAGRRALLGASASSATARRRSGGRETTPENGME